MVTKEPFYYRTWVESTASSSTRSTARNRASPSGSSGNITNKGIEKANRRMSSAGIALAEKSLLDERIQFLKDDINPQWPRESSFKHSEGGSFYLNPLLGVSYFVIFGISPLFSGSALLCMTRPCLSVLKECWFLLISAKWCVCKERLSGLVSEIWTTIDEFSVLSPSFSSNLLLNIRQKRNVRVRDLFLCWG